jgi:hypothetical protein
MYFMIDLGNIKTINLADSLPAGIEADIIAFEVSAEYSDCSKSIDEFFERKVPHKSRRACLRVMKLAAVRASASIMGARD